MNFAELLSEYIEKSGKSLRVIANECNQRGYSIDHSYISKLKTGKRQPPSNTLSRVLAEVCEQPAEPLVIAAHYEKAPPEVKELLDSIHKTGCQKDITNCPFLKFSSVESYDEITNEQKYFLEKFITKPLGFNDEEALDLLLKNKNTGNIFINYYHPQLQERAKEYYGPEWFDILTNDEEIEQLMLNENLKTAIKFDKYLDKSMSKLQKLGKEKELIVLKEALGDIKKSIGSIFNNSSPKDVMELIESNELVFEDKPLTPAEKDRLKDFMEIALEIIRKDETKKSLEDSSEDDSQS